jgi:hypothetical protein
MGGGGEGTTEAGSGEVFVQSAGEIFLEPAGEAGPESFAGTALLVDHAVSSPTSMPPITPPSTLPGMPVQIASYSGGTPGLYGGSRSKLIADKDAQLKFLQENLGKAAAFVAALNADPTLRWSGGTQVTVEQLAAYFAELTPVLLTRDIRVTNHGFRDGKPTPRQSVLQAGQYVLVDIFGVPRARCECGNPLRPPIAVATKPKYTGTPWPSFDPSTVIVIQQTTIIIETFVLIDVETGQTFERPKGSSGAQDAERTTTTTMPATTTTTMPATTTTTVDNAPVAAGELNGLWAGDFIITEVVVDQATQDGNQGCALAVLEQAKGKPLPMTLDITMDANGKGGSAVMFIDVSSLDTGEGTTSSEPQTVRFTYDGNVLTFDMSASAGQGMAGAMTGRVSRMGVAVLTIFGGMTFGDLSTMGMTADWTVTKQVVM